MSKLYNPDHLEHLVKLYNLSPSKRYGQNFLIDENVIEQIISDANLLASDTIVEVGPGFGVLTRALLPRVQKVFAFEIEKKIEEYWSKAIAKEHLDNLEIIWGNILYQFESLQEKIGATYKVVANLPYQITSQVIRMFLESPTPPTEIVVMVQKEVAERLTAKPGQLSVLALATQYYADAEYLFTVPRSAFWPVPRVDSAVVRLSVRRGEKHEGTEAFFNLIHAGFSSKRKLLFKNLLPFVGKEHKQVLSGLFAECGLDPARARAQELSLEQWQKLAKVFIKSVDRAVSA